jgi:hypothetical protein
MGNIDIVTTFMVYRCPESGELLSKSVTLPIRYKSDLTWEEIQNKVHQDNLKLMFKDGEVKPETVIFSNTHCLNKHAISGYLGYVASLN